MLVASLAIGAGTAAQAQVYVHVRPVAPIVVRTERPGPAHVWIRDDWNEEGDHYKYNGGRWESPPHEGYRYHKGHWNHDHEHGDHWQRGEWRGR